jgi:hypothetical protein
MRTVIRDRAETRIVLRDHAETRIVLRDHVWLGEASDELAFLAGSASSALATLLVERRIGLTAASATSVTGSLVVERRLSGLAASATTASGAVTIERILAMAAAGASGAEMTLEITATDAFQLLEWANIPDRERLGAGSHVLELGVFL